MILLNPHSHNRYYPDERSRQIMLQTIEFFERKGKRRIKEDDRNRTWYSDFLEFQKQECLFATLLTPVEYGFDDDCRWDTWRNCEFNEILSFYGLAYWYTWQVEHPGAGSGMDEPKRSPQTPGSNLWYFYPGWYDFGEYDYVDPENGLVFFNNRQEINPYLTVRTADSLGFFLDDQWSPIKRLTLNLGLRYDQMTTKYGKGYIYEKLTQPTDIANPVVEDERAATGNLFDFRTWSPRLGITYQLTKDGKTVVRANYGRYYMPLAVEFLRRFGPHMPLTELTYQWWQVPWDQVDLNGNAIIDIIPYAYGGGSVNEVIHAVQQIPNLAGPVFQRATEFVDGSWSLDVADGVKDMHTDQFMLNVERELVKDLSVSATYIYKRAANLFVNVPICHAHLSGVVGVTHPDPAWVMEGDPGRAADRVDHCIEDRPVRDGSRAVLHRFGLAVRRAHRGGIQVVAPDHDRRPDLPAGDQFVELKPRPDTLAISQPADARRQPLEGHLLARHP